MSLLRKIINFKKSFVRNRGANNHVFLIDENGKRREIHRLNSSQIKFIGNNNTIEIYAPVGDLVLDIKVFDNTKIILNPRQHTRKIAIYGFNNKNNSIIFGRDFSSTDVVKILLLRGNGNITIGDDCMFAYNDIIQMGDGHAIYSKNSKKPINDNKDIIIGNHVWVAADALILKGAKVSDNSIVGIKSVVTKSFDDTNVILAGIPAKVVKTDISWTRDSQY